MITKKWKGLLIGACAFTLTASAAAGGLAVGADAEEIAAVIDPIAKYEFLDAENPGKDSMGNYDLALRVADGKADGTVAVAEGVATFNGTAGLIATNDISEDLTAFTLYFEVQTTGSNSNWAAPVSFGWNDWNPTKWCNFQFWTDDLLRFTTAGSLVLDGSAKVSDVDKHNNAFWGAEIGHIGTTDFHKVALTVQPGGKIEVYLDGVVKYSYDAPETYNLRDNTMRFSLGGDSAWGNLYDPFIGSLRNVYIYDFAMTAAQVGVLNESLSIDTDDLTGQTYLTGADASTLTFADGEITSAPLYNNMTEAEMLAAMGSATVKGTLSDGTRTDIPVIWTSIEENEGVWTAYGHAQNVGLGIPSALSGDTNVTQTLTVAEAYDITVAEGIEHGSVTLSRNYGVEGDIIVVTPVPEAHYSVAEVTAQGATVELVEGEYRLTVGTSDVVVSATFEQTMYRVTVGEDVTNGTITFSANEGAYGTEIEVTATPNAHYVLSRLYVNGEQLTRVDGKYTFTLTGDTTVTADFAPAVYVIDCFVNGSGGSASADKTSASAGETVTVTVTPEDGYEVDEVTVNGSALAAQDGVYSFTVEGDAEILVIFREISVTPPDSSDSSDSSDAGSSSDSDTGSSSEPAQSSSDEDTSSAPGASSASSGTSGGSTSGGCGSVTGIAAGIALLGAAVVLVRKAKRD